MILPMSVPRAYSARLSGAIGVVACAALLAGGCGGSSATAKVKPTAYFTSVCGAVGDWVTSVKARESALVEGLPSLSSAVQGRRALQGFVADVITATHRAQTRVKAAGVPNLSDGRRVASTLRNAFDRIDGVLARAQSQTNHLPTSNPAAFSAAATQMGSSVQQALTSIGSGLSSELSPTVDKASSQIPACRSLKSL